MGISIYQHDMVVMSFPQGLFLRISDWDRVINRKGAGFFLCFQNILNVKEI